MAWKKYHYLLQTSIKNPGQYIRRPVVDVQVFGPAGNGVFTALIDSGSEITMLDSQIAEFLGIDRATAQPATASGVGGTRDAFIGHVDLKVSKFEDETLSCGILFVDQLDFDMILGQQDFFNRFLIKFDRPKGFFYLDLI